MSLGINCSKNGVLLEFYTSDLFLFLYDLLMVNSLKQKSQASSNAGLVNFELGCGRK